MALSLVPVTAFAADDHDGQVHVTVENTTWTKADGAPWEGTLVDEWVTLKDDSTMMSCIVDALAAKGYTQTGADTGYISEINGIKEKDASKDSGWMGTLNDWFTNEGLTAYTVANGKLASGEKVMAVSRVARGANGAVLGAVRYIVSMERADRQITYVVLVLIGIGVLILVLVTLSGIYFVRSIITPIRELNATAEKIAKGDFDVRVKKEKDDELGALCDSINDMAAELGTAEKMKNDFISSVSHELRTPLTAIKGWAETLQTGGIGRETYDKGMNVIVREAERLSGMVEELLDFSRMQSGRMRLILKKIDLLAELDEAVYMFTDRARTEHKNLIYDEEDTMLSPILGDVNRLRQVFINVIDNALKYTNPGGTVRVSAYEDDGFIRVIIKDSGCGIPAEHLRQKEVLQSKPKRARQRHWPRRRK